MGAKSQILIVDAPPPMTRAGSSPSPASFDNETAPPSHSLAPN